MQNITQILNTVICGDSLSVLKTFPDESVDCVITSPPYWALRKYGDDNQELGQEKTFQEYVAKLVKIFDEVKRVLKKEGTCWVNISDTYSGSGGNHKEHHKNDSGFQGKVGVRCGGKGTQKIQNVESKCLLQIPFRFAIAMTDNHWIHRNTIIWHKRNAMPSSTKDRFTVDYEFIFFFSKSKKYYFEQQFEPLSEISIKDFNSRKKFRNKGTNNIYGCPGEGRDRREFYNIKTGRNMRCVWDIPTKPSNVLHFAMYPETLVKRMIKAGCPVGGIVLDPFAGAGSTLTTAKKMDRQFIGVELYPEYIKIIQNRLLQIQNKLI